MEAKTIVKPPRFVFDTIQDKNHFETASVAIIKEKIVTSGVFHLHRKTGKSTNVVIFRFIFCQVFNILLGKKGVTLPTSYQLINDRSVPGGSVFLCVSTETQHFALKQE